MAGDHLLDQQQQAHSDWRAPGVSQNERYREVCVNGSDVIKPAQAAVRFMQQRVRGHAEAADPAFRLSAILDDGPHRALPMKSAA